MSDGSSTLLPTVNSMKLSLRSYTRGKYRMRGWGAQPENVGGADDATYPLFSLPCTDVPVHLASHLLSFTDV